MNKREFIIILIASAVGVYGLLNYFATPGKFKTGEEKKISDAITKVEVYATQTEAELTALAGQKEFGDWDYLISRAETKWPSDPFTEYKKTGDSTPDQDAPEDSAELFYTGFIKAGHKVLAVINQMEYSVGELLKEVGYKVLKISSSRVILLTESNKEIILQLKEN